VVWGGVSSCWDRRGSYPQLTLQHRRACPAHPAAFRSAFGCTYWLVLLSTSVHRRQASPSVRVPPKAGLSQSDQPGLTPPFLSGERQGGTRKTIIGYLRGDRRVTGGPCPTRPPSSYSPRSLYWAGGKPCCPRGV